MFLKAVNVNGAITLCKQFTNAITVVLASLQNQQYSEGQFYIFFKSGIIELSFNKSHGLIANQSFHSLLSKYEMKEHTFSQSFNLIIYMGSIQLPKSLSGWARYCDCLQSVQRFKTQQPEATQQEGSVHNEKAIDKVATQFFKQKLNKTNEATPQSIETPPPAKQQRLHKTKKNKHIEPLAIRKMDKQSQKISQLSEIKPEKDNIFDIVRLEEDEDVKVGYKDYLNPLTKNNEQIARATSPNLSNNFLPTKEVPTNTLYTQPYNRKLNESYFIDNKDKEEFINTGKFS